MSSDGFRVEVLAHLEKVYRETGIHLDERLAGNRISNALQIDIDPAIRAVVQTELRLAPALQVDLRELVDARPPVPGENLFVSFTAESAYFRGGNATTFGLHITRVFPSELLSEILNAGVFVRESEVSQVYQVLIYIKTPLGNISLAHSAATVGFDENGRLVSYLTFQSSRGLKDSPLNPPSQLTPADRPALLYVFLTLAVFMAVNQGEAPLRWVGERAVVVD